MARHLKVLPRIDLEDYMATVRDPVKIREALDLVCRRCGIRREDVIRTDLSITGNTNLFVLRLDYTSERGGGYQVFEGIMGFGAEAMTAVLGKGKVTPKFPLQSTQTKTEEELREEERVLRIRLEYTAEFLDDRII